jgi:hypothetical protein
VLAVGVTGSATGAPAPRPGLLRQWSGGRADYWLRRQLVAKFPGRCVESAAAVRRLPGGRAAASQPRSPNLVLPASGMGAVALLHWRVTGVALLIHWELGRGRHRHQPRCRHRSCASHKPMHRGPRWRLAEHDSSRSPRLGECCIARWWQRARWRATTMGKKGQYRAPGGLILSIRTFGVRRRLARVKIDASRFALTHGRGGVSARRGAGPTGPLFPGVSLTN